MSRTKKWRTGTRQERQESKRVPTEADVDGPQRSSGNPDSEPEILTIGSVLVKSDRVLADWLGEMILTFQDESRRPPRSYSNLEDLTEPAQIVAFCVTTDRGWTLAELAILHEESIPNGKTWALSFDDIRTLASVAGSADAAFGSKPRKLVHSDSELHVQRGPLAVLAHRLSKRLRGAAPPLQEPTQQVQAPERSAASIVGGSSFWTVQFTHPLPSPADLLVDVSRPLAVATAGGDSDRAPRRPTKPPKVVVEAVAGAHGAFCEPPVWFGVDPFNLPHEDVLGYPPPVRRDPKLVFEGVLSRNVFRVYSNGLVLTLARSSESARKTVNQFFAAMSRCGIPATAASVRDLISVSGFDAERLPVGSSGAMTHRNRAMSMERTLGAYVCDDLLVVAPIDVPRISEAAQLVADDAALSEQSSRLLIAATAELDGQHTAAFVMYWTVLEAVLQKKFELYWRGRGRSKTKADAMVKDWPSSHQIDALNAGGQIDDERCRQLHGLRKVRNAIVHNLREASGQETRTAGSLALEMADLPTASPRLVVHRALVM